jgi:hypothetical protein
MGQFKAFKNSGVTSPYHGLFNHPLPGKSNLVKRSLYSVVWESCQPTGDKEIRWAHISE